MPKKTNIAPPATLAFSVEVGDRVIIQDGVDQLVGDITAIDGDTEELIFREDGKSRGRRVPFAALMDRAPEKADLPGNPRNLEFTKGMSVFHDDGGGNVVSGVIQSVDGTTVKTAEYEFDLNSADDAMFDDPKDAQAWINTGKLPDEPDEPERKVVETKAEQADLLPPEGKDEEPQAEEPEAKAEEPKAEEPKAKAEEPEAQVPATRQAAVALPTNGGGCPGVSGDFFDDADMLDMPRIGTAQNVKDHMKAGLEMGDIYFADQVLVPRTGKDVGDVTEGPEIAVLRMDGMWVENVPFDTEKKDGSLPLIARTREEMRELTPKCEYEWAQTATLVVAIRQPEGFDDELGLFMFEDPTGGAPWAMATLAARGASFRSIVKPVNTAAKFYLRGKLLAHGKWRIENEIVEGKNIFAKTRLVRCGDRPDDQAEFLESLVATSD